MDEEDEEVELGCTSLVILALLMAALLGFCLWRTLDALTTSPDYTTTSTRPR